MPLKLMVFRDVLTGHMYQIQCESIEGAKSLLFAQFQRTDFEVVQVVQKFGPRIYGTPIPTNCN